MTFRDLCDRLWPTLAPHDADYAGKRVLRLETNIRCARESCGVDQARRAKYLEGVREEFADETRRRESVLASLRSLLVLPGAIATAIVGLGIWIIQSHTLQVTRTSAVVMMVLAGYPVLQFIAALRATVLGLSVRPFQGEPHTAKAFADTMDVAEETLRANQFNEDQTDDRVSYKKIAIRSLLNAGIGLIPLVLGILIVAARNFTSK